MKGLGCDIIEIERVKQTIEKHGQSFLNRTFTEKEQAYCFKHRFPESSFAARFAGKEAVAKALGTGFGQMLTFLDIEITNNPDGKPIVTLSQEAKAAFNNPEILLSLSHSKSHAMATAISK